VRPAGRSGRFRGTSQPSAKPNTDCTRPPLRTTAIPWRNSRRGGRECRRCVTEGVVLYRIREPLAMQDGMYTDQREAQEPDLCRDHDTQVVRPGVANLHETLLWEYRRTGSSSAPHSQSHEWPQAGDSRRTMPPAPVVFREENRASASRLSIRKGDSYVQRFPP